MMSHVNSSFRFVGAGFIVSLATLALPASPASAQSELTSDNWSVGSADADDTSVGLAATVNVPVPPGNGPAVYSTAGTPMLQPAPDARRPLTAAQPPLAAPPQAQTPEYEDTDPSALDAFRSELDPYGRWIDDSRYGRVWVPDAGYVGSDFEPYVTHGHWGLDTENNWVWMSDYAFGWVVFHYGRWVWIDSVGWSWVPGRRYAPAWVVWRVPTDDYAYVGWAPAPPTYGWFGDGAYWLGFYPPLPFVFCPSYYMFYPHFGAYLVRDRYFAATLVRHSAWYSTGPVYGRGYSSPTFASARVPAAGIPSQRVAADPRATSMARVSANPSMAGRPSAGSVARSSRAGFGSRPASLSPGGLRPVTAGEHGGYGGGFGTRYSSAPSMHSSSLSGGYYPNSFSTRPRSFGDGSSYSSGRQVQSLGSLPGGSYASPRSSYSAPRYSSPSSSFSGSHFSTPSSSFSSSGRSFSGGGGGFRGGGGSRGGGGRHR